MQLFGKDLSSDVAVVAEIGVNHEGNVDVAAQLVEDVARAGANAVKFQSYTPERFILRSDAERFARASCFALDEAAHRRLAKIAEANGIAFFSAAITEDWVPLIAEIGAAIKIASGDLNFEPVIAAAAQTDKPVILSTGAGTTQEIATAIGWFRAAADVNNMHDRLALLHCVSAYPTPLEEANLLSIPFLRDTFGYVTGWSNHVIGAEACLTAVALGARIIEVHVTDRKTGRDFRDHALSFEPEELARLVEAVKRVHESLGSYGKEPGPSEAPMRPAIRKGVIAARDLPAGTLLQPSDLLFARPANEFAAGDVGNLLNRRVIRNVARGASLPRAAIE